MQTLGSPRTIFLVTILSAHDGAAPEHHLVLGQRPRLVGEDVLDLAQVLGDVQGSALNGQIGLLVVEVKVIVQEEYLPQLHQLNGHVQRDRDQHLGGDDAHCVSNQQGSLPPDPHSEAAKASDGKLRSAHRMFFV